MYGPPTPYKLVNLTSYMATDRGLWMRTKNLFRLNIRNLVSADMAVNTHMRLAWAITLKNALIVGKSANEDSINAAQGISIYDGPISYENIHFEAFHKEKAPAIGLIGALLKNPSRFKRVTFNNCSNEIEFGLTPSEPKPDPNLRADERCLYCSIPDIYDSVIEDVDGSITGISGATMVPRIDYGSTLQNNRGNEMNIFKPKCNLNEKYKGWVCQEVIYGLITIVPPGASNDLKPIYMSRSDGVGLTWESGQIRNTYQMAVITNQGLDYTVDFNNTMATYGTYRLSFVQNKLQGTRMKLGLKSLRAASRLDITDSGKILKIPSVDALYKLDAVNATSLFTDRQTNDVYLLLVADINDENLVDPLMENKPWNNWRAPGIRIIY